MKKHSVILPAATVLIAVLLCGCGGGGGGGSCCSNQTSTGRISGYVYAPIGGTARAAGAPTGYAPLEDAEVTVSGTSLSANTNENGYYLLSGVPTGSRTVYIAKSGYATIEKKVTVEKGETAVATAENSTEGAVRLTTSGAVTVASEPSGASIFIDSTATGFTTPHTLEGISAGVHSISVSLDQYSASVQTVTVSQGATSTADFALTYIKKWTLLGYINGDTCDHIEGPSLVPVQEFEQVGSSDEVNVVVQRDLCRTPWPNTNAIRLYVKQGEGNSETIEDLGEKDMGDYETLIDFIEWGKESYPAEHYLLYFYGHGSGFYVKNGTWAEPEAARAAGAFIYDYNGDGDNTPTTIDIHQLRYALEKTGLHPDAVIFGPCLMGMVEVAYELRNVADILVASEETTMYFGGDLYAETLRMLVDVPDTTAAALAGFFVQKYVDLFRERSDLANYSGTLSATDLSKVEALAIAIDIWGDALAQDAAATRANISAAQSFSGYPFRDIGHFAALQGGAEAQAVITALDDALIASDHYGPDVLNANGLSIYLTPYPSGSYYTGHKKLKFADEVAGWMSYIEALAQ